MPSKELDMNYTRNKMRDDESFPPATKSEI